MVKYPPELDVTQLQKILRAHWKAYLAEKPSLELCKSLIMLRDVNISGRINMLDIPVLMHMLQFWKVHTTKKKKKPCPIDVLCAIRARAFISSYERVLTFVTLTDSVSKIRKGRESHQDVQLQSETVVVGSRQHRQQQSARMPGTEVRQEPDSDLGVFHNGHGQIALGSR